MQKKRAHGLEHAVRAGTDTGEHRRAEKPRGLPRGREHGPAQTNKTAAEDVGPALCIVAPCGSSGKRCVDIGDLVGIVISIGISSCPSNSAPGGGMLTRRPLQNGRKRAFLELKVQNGQKRALLEREMRTAHYSCVGHVLIFMKNLKVHPYIAS